MLEFRILGPVELRRDGAVVPVNALKVRALLVALLLNANEVVSVDRLLDVLWDTAPPVSALANLRTYVAALRHALGGDSARLTTHAHGIGLTVLPDELDAAVFERLAGQGRIALRSKAFDVAAAQLRRGLALWNGTEAASGLPRTGVLARWLLPWDEQLLTAHEDLAAAALAMGDDSGLVPALLRAVAEHPLRERSWALLMRALCRSGDVAAALDAYARVRRTLLDELGVEPGPELAGLQVAALARDPELCSPVRVTAQEPPAAAPPTAPRELPAATLLAGRGGVLDRLVHALQPGLPGPVVVALHGPPGVGKSALAIAAAHLAAPSFPDGQVYVNLGGRTGETQQGALLHVLRSLDVRARPAPAAALSAVLRSALAQRRVLLVLDDASDVSQVLPLLPAGQLCGVLITSRRRLSTLDAARNERLGPLAPECSGDLLARFVPAERLGAEPAAVRRLVLACGNLPLALRIAAARLAGHPGLTVGELADRLESARRPLDELTLDDLSVRDRLLEQVATLSEAARATLGRLAAARGSCDGLPSGALEELADAELLEHEDGRWHATPLVRMLADELGPVAVSIDLNGRRAGAHS